jgi:choline-glycine betaine transporter
MKTLFAIALWCALAFAASMGMSLIAYGLEWWL